MAVTEFHGDRQIKDGTIDKDDLNSTLQDEIDAKVVGPASSTDNAIARFDSTTGKLIQNSGLTISDNSFDQYTLASPVALNITSGSGNDDGIYLNTTSLSGITLTANAGIGLNGTSGVSTNGGLKTNTIDELTSTSGVTIDGVLIKDGLVDARDVSVDGTKLDTVETNADVTDTANVTAAGALMDSEVDADIKTLSLPANTTISTFGASLVDDTTAANARTTLGVTDANYLNSNTTKSDVGLGNVDNTSDATKNSATATLTNKTISGANNTVSQSIQYAFFASLGATQSVTTGADRKINCNTEDYDVGSNYDNATNYRFTAPVTGYYTFGARTGSSGTTTARIYAMFYKNGSEWIRGLDYPSVSAVPTSLVNVEAFLTAGDYVEFYIRVLANITLGSGSQTYFYGRFLGH